MACFSCNENKTETETSILLMYQEKYNKTGEAYWFFKKKGDNELFIISNEDYKNFKKANKTDFKNKKYEFAHIAEFVVVENS